MTFATTPGWVPFGSVDASGMSVSHRSQQPPCRAVSPSSAFPPGLARAMLIGPRSWGLLPGPLIQWFPLGELR